MKTNPVIIISKPTFLGKQVILQRKNETIASRRFKLDVRNWIEVRLCDQRALINHNQYFQSLALPSDFLNHDGNLSLNVLLLSLAILSEP